MLRGLTQSKKCTPKTTYCRFPPCSTCSTAGGGALVHIEGMWTENAMTAEGRVLHECAHQPGAGNSDGVRTARGLRLCSRELGLFGVADIVEFTG